MAKYFGRDETVLHGDLEDLIHEHVTAEIRAAVEQGWLVDDVSQLQEDVRELDQGAENLSARLDAALERISDLEASLADIEADIEAVA